MHIAILLARLPAPTAMIRTHSFLFVFDFFGVCFRILLACVSFAAPLLSATRACRYEVFTATVFQPPLGRSGYPPGMLPGMLKRRINPSGSQQSCCEARQTPP